MKFSLLFVALMVAQFATAQDTTATLKAYQNYDFVAGNKIIFEDNFSTDPDGEFPIHWSLENGQAVVNKFQNAPTLLLTDGNYASVSPLIKGKNYLPNEFTVEFDVFQAGEAYQLHVWFKNADKEDGLGYDINSENVTCNFLDEDKNQKELHGTHPADKTYENYLNKWHHVAMIYKNKLVKIYTDERRSLVVPNCNFVPDRIFFGGIGSSENPIVVRNVKIAAGGDANTLGKMFTDGKYISHGIRFDVNKTTLRPEAMGEINAIAKILKENTALKFEISGHTDTDGDAVANLTLSQRRADAVKAQLVILGISADRLTTKGYGITKPISENTTFEGKADNRRVEFTKL